MGGDNLEGEGDGTSESGLTLDRRTALVGLAGVAGGGVLGYRTFLADDEPAFAQEGLDLGGNNVDITTTGGNLTELNIGTATEIQFSYSNFPSAEFTDGTNEFYTAIYLESPADSNTTAPSDGDISDKDITGLDISRYRMFHNEGDLIDMPTDNNNNPEVPDSPSTISEELSGFDDNSITNFDGSAIPIADHPDISLSDFEPSSKTMGASKTTQLTFTVVVLSDTLSRDTEVPLPDGDTTSLESGYLDPTDSTTGLIDSEDVWGYATEDLYVNVEIVTEDQIDVSVGGNIVLEATAENEVTDGT
ncbi:hypothetical protein C476_17907 [Natrinema limicola JCM 13563]|uniref:Uncharacterized protein n=2 Tax=Natrinema limicola TaxID=370323 RepID=M0BZ61_9EURY|nr:hypothetical protein C476_17907 [Natrinema limicola JCM 13563]